MIVKRYIGKTTQEAMNKLRVELGPEAIILHTRKIKKSGVFTFLKKPLVEIVAAIDEDNEEDSKKKNTRNSVSKVSRVSRTPNYKNHGYNSTPRQEFGSTVSQKPTEKKVNTDFFNKLDVIAGNKKTDNDEIISDEIKKLRGTMEGFMKNFESNLYKNFNLPEELRSYKETLVNNGVSEVVANSILGNIDKNINLDGKTPKELDQIIKFNIAGYLDNPSPIRNKSQQKIIFFVGPTGVGKTTTLAKLAAYYTLEKKLDVGLVTADTYRIAAVEQLKTYSNILDIPIKIVYEKEDFNEVLSNFINKDMIFVDTAGRSHRNESQIKDLKNLLSSIDKKEVYLVLSATTNVENIKNIIKQYKFIEKFKIIFTKTDEVDSLGVILNTKFYNDQPLSYITTGQNVPEDIEIVNIEKLTDELIGETKHERSS